MYYLISIQGKYAVHYRFKEQSAQNFKALVQAITGKCCAVVSSRFRTDVIYCSNKITPKNILQLWAMNLHEEFSRKQRHLFIFKSGKENVLNYYFSSLNKLSHLSDWYQEYVSEFNQLLSLDRNNPVLKMIAECDNYLIRSHHAEDRPPLVGQGYVQSPLDENEIIWMLRDLLERPEKSN